MKLTVIGVISRLRKYWRTDIASVGPAKEPESKKDGDNKQKDGGGGGGGGGDPNDDDGKDDKDNKENGGRDGNSHYPPPPMPASASYVHVHEENPNYPSKRKVVLKLDLHDDKDKQKAMNAVSKIPYIDSIAIDMKDMKLTVIGYMDPITVVYKLRKYWRAELASVGPAKEPEKKMDGDNKQKDGGGGGGGDPNDDDGKDDKDDKDNKENGGSDEGDEGSSGEKKEEDSAGNDAFLNLAAYHAWRSNVKMAHAAILIILAAVVSQVQQWHSKALSLSDALHLIILTRRHAHCPSTPALHHAQTKRSNCVSLGATVV